MSSTAVQKVLSKLQANLDAGNFYEAQQIVKSVYYRHRSRKQFQQSYELLEEAAQLQFTKGQFTCGLELALLLTEAYTTDKVVVSQEALSRIHNILANFPKPSRSDEDPGESHTDGAVRFIIAAIKWAKQNGGTPEETAGMHDELAAYIWACRAPALGAAAAHFARGQDHFAFAAALVEAAAQGGEEEEDLFVGRAVLQVLAAATPSTQEQQVRGGRELMQAVEGIQGSALPDTPFTHFIAFLLQALEHKSLKLFKALRREYAGSLERDPALLPLLDRIEGVYFGGSEGGMGGMLGDILKMLSAP